MKKLLLSIFAIILCIPSLILVGCGEKPNYISMSTYFSSEVKFTVYNQGESKTTLNKLTSSNNNDLNKYTSITVKGNNDWLYLMTIESVSFEIYSNISDEVEFTVRITNLKNGNQSNVGGSSVFEKTVSPNLKKNKATKVTISVNDIVNSRSTETKIEIKVDGSYFYGDNQELGFKYSIQNLKVAGQHK